MNNVIYKVGLDIGSTTVKTVVTADHEIIHTEYTRHYSKITETAAAALARVQEKFGGVVSLAISGSAGMGLAEYLGVMFVQEVYATKVALADIAADVAIELGGEDAKILFLSGGLEVRMNGTCAGGTGSFIDQMAMLLGVTADGLNELSRGATGLYPIASRCGVFAKTDIQPLLNQGADRADLARSILQAIVNQTVGGLAQGREITGKIAYLGGPLTFMDSLRLCFDETLGCEGILPDHSLYFVALGASRLADKPCDLGEIIKKTTEFGSFKSFKTLRPLFSTQQEYDGFCERHKKSTVAYDDISGYRGKAYLGIDAGSTTVKMVVIGEGGQLLDSRYQSNKGNPVELARDYITYLYDTYPALNLVSGAATGYGEDLIKNAFDLPVSLVETAAHFTAARHLEPNVDFVIDIGGQDMKCFSAKNGAVDDIFLNEACSSGCGSFLQTFAEALGFSAEEFAKKALFAKKPVDLGSRCTVFMNSSVKQAQKDGAGVDDISAGLAASVIKNALYKVIRVRDKHALGKSIVVQGGTFMSDAVLRAFEQEMDAEVIRPSIAGLMGAFGAALFALNSGAEGIISRQDLAAFSYATSAVSCGLCTNNCSLTVNRFDGGRKFISGNKCERPVTGKNADKSYNIFEYKLRRLARYIDENAENNEESFKTAAALGANKGADGAAKEAAATIVTIGKNAENFANSLSEHNAAIAKNAKNYRGEIAIPTVLNMYELLPFWHAFFSRLGIRVTASQFSSPATFKLGQSSIPSDTVCYPAKLVHGHVISLIRGGAKNIFYPCMSYNIDEKISKNHYNCPVVAYYPQVIGISVPEIKSVNFIQPFVDLGNKKVFCRRVLADLLPIFPFLTAKEIKSATAAGFAELDSFKNDLRCEGERILRTARENGMGAIVLAGRPYHADPEVHHGIPSFVLSMGMAVLSEDCLPLSQPTTTVLNQWTYHARMYSAAQFVAGQKNVNLVQLVSFGCGLDAVTADEVRRQLEKSGKLYTQLKIDEITNLGAVKIRLKSLLAALGSANFAAKGGRNG